MSRSTRVRGLMPAVGLRLRLLCSQLWMVIKRRCRLSAAGSPGLAGSLSASSHSFTFQSAVKELDRMGVDREQLTFPSS